MYLRLWTREYGVHHLFRGNLMEIGKGLVRITMLSRDSRTQIIFQLPYFLSGNHFNIPNPFTSYWLPFDSKVISVTWSFILPVDLLSRLDSVEYKMTQFWSVYDNETVLVSSGFTTHGQVFEDFKLITWRANSQAPPYQHLFETIPYSSLRQNWLENQGVVLWIRYSCWYKSW